MYLQQFWRTVSKVHGPEGTIKFMLNTQEFVYTVDMFHDILHLQVETPDNPFVAPVNIETIKAFMNRVGYEGVVDKVSVFYTKNLAQPWQTLFKMFNRCLTTRTSGHDQTKINILQMFHVVINRTNDDYAALLWWDFMNNVKKKKEAIQYPRFNKLRIADLMNKFPDIPQRIKEDYHSIKDDIPLVSVYTIGDVCIREMLILGEFLTEDIHATDDFKEYETVFMNVDVLINQPQPVVSTQGTHRSTPSAHMIPTLTASPQGRKRKQSAGESRDDRERDAIAEATLLSLTLHKTALAAEAKEGIAKVQEKLNEAEIEEMVEGEEDEESYESAFADIVFNDDVDDTGSKIKPGSHKENLEKVNDDDVVIKKEKKDDDVEIEKEKKDDVEINKKRMMTMLRKQMRNANPLKEGDTWRKDILAKGFFCEWKTNSTDNEASLSYDYYLANMTYNNIKPTHSKKTIEVRVYQKWTARNVRTEEPSNFCSILLDKQGNAIQVNMDLKDTEYFDQLLQLNNAYMISRFTFESRPDVNGAPLIEMEKPVVIVVSSTWVTKRYEGLQLIATPATYYYLNPNILEVHHILNVYANFINLIATLQIQRQPCNIDQKEQMRNRYSIELLLNVNLQHYKRIKFTTEAIVLEVSAAKGWYCFRAIIDDGTVTTTINCFSPEAHNFVTECNEVVNVVENKDTRHLPDALKQVENSTYIFQYYFGKGARPGDPDFNLDDAFKPTTQPLLSLPRSPPEILQQTSSIIATTAKKDDPSPSTDDVDKELHTNLEETKKTAKKELFTNKKVPKKKPRQQN
nr:hypothetical protein [Tanacetum cinerariifolium]